MEYDQKKHLVFVLAALLHDIGKFWQRTGRPGLHSEASAIFIDEFQHLFPYDYLDDLRDAVMNHHRSPVHKEIEKIVKIADWLASYERVTESIERQDPEKTPLVPIASRVKLLHNPPQEKWRLRLKELRLCHDNIFPDIGKNVQVSSTDYHNLWAAFSNELHKFTIIDDPLKVVGLLSLLRKYASFIPSATPWEEDEEYRTFPDISLYDHLKVAAAIASCLFWLLPDDIDALYWRKSEAEDKPVCLMVRGDISGIQKFIYRITEPHAEAKGTAKRLRGRSFYLSLLSDVVADWIIRQLGLTSANILFCSGGRFDMLLPVMDWTNHTNPKLIGCERKLERWLLDTFHGELGIQVAKTLITPNDLSDMKSANNRLNDLLAEEKLRKFHSCFDEHFFVPKDIHHLCNVCQIEPLHDPGTCDGCKKHEEIGQKIPKISHIIYCFGDPNRSFQPDFHFGDPFNVYVGLLNENDVNNVVESTGQVEGKRVIYKLNSTDFIYDNAITEVTFGFKFLGNEAPIALQDLPATNDEKPTNKGDVLSFEDISRLSKGASLLGILKADVDRLGLIFGEGIEPMSISRISTLSNTFELFFSGWLNNICVVVSSNWKRDVEKTNNSKKNWVDEVFYIVYSGGDDLLIVGPWDQVIEIAQELYRDFRDYTCWNRNITLSAAIIPVKPHFPIQRFVHLVSEELEKSKNDGDKPETAGLKEKNRITLFDETVEWREGTAPERSFEELLAFSKKLAAQVENKESSLPKGFVYFLHRLEQFFYKKGSLMWVPKFFYSLARRVNKEVMLDLDLQSKVPAVMGKMSVPVSYVSLITRKE